MNIIKYLMKGAIFVLPVFATAQSTYIPFGSKGYDFIDRMEIKLQENKSLNFSTLKPYSRKAIVQELELIDSLKMTPTDSARGFNKYGDRSDLELNPVDEYNLRSLLMDNLEWVKKPRPEFESGTPFLQNFYKTPANLYEVNIKDFFLVLNPLLNIQVGTSSDGYIYYNSRGLTTRGLIANKIGFSASVTDNQERGPAYFQNRVNQFHAVPGVGFYKPFKTTGFDYFDARGYFTFNATKYIDFQLGYDKNFIGNGYRSLFLGNNGNSNLFVKINTRIWKLNYQNLFMELMPQFKKLNGDTLLDRKYAAMHHLSMNVTKWLNVGFFEGVIFGRKNQIELEYLNPIIFLRSIEGTVGSPDNAFVGMDFKANVAHTAQVYGQFLLDEFVLSEITKNRGYWANKFGGQLGIKYVDAFNISNLDLQMEANFVRPFTYSHNDTIGNYTHYNQMLAHPLGANFFEVIGIAKYQPKPKLYFTGKIIYYTQGLDSAGRNFGSNPLESYTTRVGNYGFKIGSGNKAHCINASVLGSYEFRQNLFVEAQALIRDFRTAVPSILRGSTSLITVGIRWNMFRREYDL